jgi:hypothetical protein
VPSLFFGVLWRQSVHEKKKKSKNRFPHLPCVCVSIHRWYELVHAYMKDTHLFIEIDARKKHERRMQTHNNRTKKAKWVLSDFAKWHASSNSKFIWPPSITILLYFPVCVGWVNISTTSANAQKNFGQPVNRQKSFLCCCPSQLNSWGENASRMWFDERWEKEEANESVVCLFFQWAPPRSGAAWLGNPTRIKIVYTQAYLSIVWNN